MKTGPKPIGVAALLERNSITEPNSGCYLWTGWLHRNGYASLRLSYKGKNQMAHRLTWEVCNGPVPDGMEVCHRCDMPSCVNPDHLFLGTHRDNMVDCARKERNAPKLTADAVRMIRQSDKTHASLARDLGVSGTMIAHIRKGRAWTHVT